MSMHIPRYWVVTASADHARVGQELGMVQACHGKSTPLRRMRAGDGVVIYAPRDRFAGGRPLQAFVALGLVADDRVWQADMAGGFRPFRRAVHWWPARMAPIRPLLPVLDLTRGEAQWGMAFRFGLRALTAADFARIAAAMDSAAPLGQTAGASMREA